MYKHLMALILALGLVGSAAGTTDSFSDLESFTADFMEEETTEIDWSESHEETESWEKTGNSQDSFYSREKKIEMDFREIEIEMKSFDSKFFEKHPKHRPGKEKDRHYQVDFVGGEEPIEDLSESMYHEEGRMQRYIHGSPGTPIGNETESDQVKTGTGGPDCVDSEPFTVDTFFDTATVEFTVHDREACDPTTLTLVSYSKPFAGWVASRADEQEIFDHETESFDPGHHSMTVDIPDAN